MVFKWSTLKYPLLILLVTVIGFFWFFIYAPIYDFADEFFPGRYFMLESIRNGIFPLWIPYQSMGLPVHADPQAGTFYLPLWILSLFTNYTPFCWGVEFVFHAFFAGLGFYYLSQQFTDNKKIRFIGALIYIFSGFFVGNVQHISWIIAGTWIPWILHFAILLFQKPSLKASLLLALSTSLLFNGGYPGFWILSAYLFGVLSLFMFLTNYKKWNKQQIKKRLVFIGLSGIVTLIFILPALISFIEIKTYMTRGLPLAYESQISCSYSPRSFLSLLFPFIANSEGSFIQNDISMASIFVGVTTIPFLILGILKRKNTLLRFFIAIGIVALLLSMGKYLPFHKWAFEYIPLINMMRLPSIFRLFVIIPLIMIIIHGLDAYWKEKDSKLVFYFMLSLLLIFSGVIIYLLFFEEIYVIDEFKTLTWNNLLTKSIPFKFLIQSIIQWLLIAGITIGFYFSKKNKNLLVAILIFDLLLNATLCIHKTGYMYDRTNKEISEFLNKMPKDYVVPTEITSSNQIYWKTTTPSLWRNLGIFTKQVEWFSYKGVILNDFEIMTTPNQHEGKELYFPKLAYYPQVILYSETPLPISEDYAYTMDKSMVKSYPDSTSFLDLCVFEPGNIFVKTHNHIDRPLVICQSYYPGWKAKLNTGKSLVIKPLNSSMISVMVPKGEQYIRFYYHRPELIFSFVLQMIGYALLFIVLGFNFFRFRAFPFVIPG